MSLSTGPVFQVKLIDLGEDQPQRLLVLCHHAIVDYISFQILMRDFTLAYGQLANGEEIRLHRCKRSFESATNTLQEYADSDSILEELRYWLELPWEKVEPVPLDYSNVRRNDLSSADSYVVELGVEEATRLTGLQALSEASVYEILLSVLSLCLSNLNYS